jgi:hypothetical protein
LATRNCVTANSEIGSDGGVISVLLLLLFLGVYKFIFLVDFIINDMEKDHQNPLILRCWFLATGRNRCPIWQAHIRVQDEQVTFNVF